jgi:transposase
MRDAELFQVALGLSFPWKVMSSDFDAQAGRLDIRIDFPRGSRFCCPTCGTSGPAYDTREMTWRHLNFFQHEAHLHARVPRVQCSRCGVTERVNDNETAGMID